MLYYLKKTLAVLMSILLVHSYSIHTIAQEADPLAPELETMMVERPQVPMQNVFYNVLWGSLTGGMLMMGWATIDDSKTTDERYTVSHLSNQFLSGATYGGLLGLAAGVYISMKGITFDESRSKLVFMEPVKPDLVNHKNARTRVPKMNDQEFHLIKFQMNF